MDVHRRHNALSGHPAHFAKQATLAVRKTIGETSLRAAMTIHRDGDKATHSWDAPGRRWADVEDDEDNDAQIDAAE